METKAIKVRGTATINPDNSFDFTPSQQGEPVQRSVRKSRKSKMYETAGVERQSMVCHLVVDKTLLILLPRCSKTSRNSPRVWGQTSCHLP